MAAANTGMLASATRRLPFPSIVTHDQRNVTVMQLHMVPTELHCSISTIAGKGMFSYQLVHAGVEVAQPDPASEISPAPAQLQRPRSAGM